MCTEKGEVEGEFAVEHISPREKAVETPTVLPHKSLPIGANNRMLSDLVKSHLTVPPPCSTGCDSLPKWIWPLDCTYNSSRAARTMERYGMLCILDVLPEKLCDECLEEVNSVIKAKRYTRVFFLQFSMRLSYGQTDTV
jgi:hypothetical protein